MSAAVDGGDDHVAKNDKGHRRRHNKERNILEPILQALAQHHADFFCVPNALDMAGNSAAEIAMPNKLTGK